MSYAGTGIIPSKRARRGPTEFITPGLHGHLNISLSCDVKWLNLWKAHYLQFITKNYNYIIFRCPRSPGVMNSVGPLLARLEGIMSVPVYNISDVSALDLRWPGWLRPPWLLVILTSDVALFLRSHFVGIGLQNRSRVRHLCLTIIGLSPEWSLLEYFH